MLEKIANRRIVNAEEKDKVVVKTALLNTLTALNRFSAEGHIHRRQKYETNLNTQVKIENKKALCAETNNKILVT